MKSTGLLWALLLAVAGWAALATPGNAASLHYTLQNVNDGAGDSFAGQFDYDTVSGAYTNLAITASGVNTAGETFTTAGIQPVNTGPTSLQVNTAIVTIVSVHFAANLGTQPPGVPDAIVNFVYSDSGHNLHISAAGDIVATPLPAALPLFASGLGAIGFIGWRRKRKNAIAA